MRLPAWFQEAKVIADAFARSPDAEFVLDGVEDDWGVSASALEWRECTVPISAFDLPVSINNVQWAAKLAKHDPEGERERMHTITTWVNERGGIEQALQECPLILTLREGRATIEDGAHRLLHAAYERRVSTVRVICAVLSTKHAMNVSQIG